MQELRFLSGLTAADWAAWVQAIGSVAALLVAIGVARHATNANRQLVDAQLSAQLAAQERERTAQKQERVRAERLRYVGLLGPPIALLHGLLTRLTGIRIDTQLSNEVLQFAPDCLDHARMQLSELTSIRASDMPTPRSTAVLLSARVCAEETFAIVAEMVANTRMLAPLDKLAPKADEGLTRLRSLRESLKAELAWLADQDADLDITQMLDETPA